MEHLRALGRRRGSGGRRLRGAVVPVVHFVATSERLGTVCSLEVLAEHAGPVEDGLQLLDELDACWGPGGELDVLDRASIGTSVALTWESLLLLGTMVRAGASGGLDLDVAHASATRTGPARTPTADEMHAVAVDLVAQELRDSGCLAARVSAGGRTRTVNEDQWRSFRRPVRATRRPAP